MLSAEQQQQIIDNEWIINTVCKRLNITDNDIRSELTLFMCQTVAKYDESKGATLKTYLFSSVYLRALRLLALQGKYKYYYILTDIAPSPVECHKPHTNSKMKIVYKHIQCKTEEKIIKYKLEGYTGKEISTKLKMSAHQVNRTYRKFVKRVQQEIQNNPEIDA